MQHPGVWRKADITREGQSALSLITQTHSRYSRNRPSTFRKCESQRKRVIQDMKHEFWARKGVPATSQCSRHLKSAAECIILYIYMHPEKYGVTAILLTRKTIPLGESCSQPRVSEKTQPSETGRFKAGQWISPGNLILNWHKWLFVVFLLPELTIRTCTRCPFDNMELTLVVFLSTICSSVGKYTYVLHRCW